MAAPPSALDGNGGFRSRDMGDWLKGVLHGAVGVIVGFFAGLLVAGVLAMDPTPIVPTVVIAGTPIILALGGFAFGFSEGVSGA